MPKPSRSWLSNKRLLLKLFAYTAFLILIGAWVRWYLVEYKATDYFADLVQGYDLVDSPALREFLMEAARSGLLWSHLVSLLTAVVVAFMLLKLVLNPLNRVILATRKIAGGDFTSRVPASRNDEIGELGKSFNSMTENLQRMDELRRKMVIDIAHELRAPLTNIRGYLEALGSGALSSTPAIVQSLQEEALRLSNLTDSMMRLSVADAARLTLQKERGDLCKLIEQSLDFFGEHFSRQGITVSTHFSDAVQHVRADFEKLAQVIQNLLDNALRYTPSEGCLRVSVERISGSVLVILANSGEPIGDEHLPRLFERFYRVDPSRSRELGGAGIGLAIVKELVEAHGGEIGAESGPNENRIWFTLPT